MWFRTLKAKCRMDWMGWIGWLSYTAVTSRASLQSDANKHTKFPRCSSKTNGDGTVRISLNVWIQFAASFIPLNKMLRNHFPFIIIYCHRSFLRRDVGHGLINIHIFMKKCIKISRCIYNVLKCPNMTQLCTNCCESMTFFHLFQKQKSNHCQWLKRN